MPTAALSVISGEGGGVEGSIRELALEVKYVSSKYRSVLSGVS